MGASKSKECSCLRRRRRSTAYEEETSSSRSIEIEIQQNDRPLRTRARKTKSKCFSHMIPKKILCCLKKDDMSMTKIERSESFLPVVGAFHLLEHSELMSPVRLLLLIIFTSSVKPAAEKIKGQGK
ncbi:hypothetical protein Zmor_009429 [Zophobas morio]|uniref:Uncharacterized protein n=1 Tax=Zophobas morio TaxID=2755281 RepID=A0AA38IPA7_9CUCU|nr:hypothetical protein Zmor_009429 [Zophobas morio]